MQQGYPPAGQPYYPAAQYPPQTYVPSYPYPQYPIKPLAPPGPGYHPFPAPVYPVASEPYEPPPPVQAHSSSKSKHGIRRSRTTPAPEPPPKAPNPRAVPARSAMKKPQHDRSASMGSNVMPSMSRTSSRTSDQRHRTTSTSSRPRGNSIPPPPPFVSEHVFVVFINSNELQVENIPHDYLVEEFRQSIPFEWPHGVTNEEKSNQRWMLRFAGAPWASSGTDSIIARKMIHSLYRILAAQGFHYVTTINTSNPPARLVFEHATPDPMADFFSVLLSQSGDKLSLWGIHEQMAHALGDSLRAQFPHKIASDRAREDGVYVIEVKKGMGIGADVERGAFHAYVLRFFSASGYKLDGSIPMGKSGPLGFGSRKEMWIFRGSRARPSSSRSHYSQRDH